MPTERVSGTIYVAGHSGLVGSAVVRALEGRGRADLVLRTHRELDLTEAAPVRSFFTSTRPDTVVLCAAKVGGIGANHAYPADFVRENLAIEMNVIHEAWRAGVERLVFLGSSCIYPRDCPQPIREESLLTGPLEPTNRAYAVAKIAGIETCWAYNRQHGTRYLALMPTNLYGPGDSYDLENSHVLPALIRKIDDARSTGEPEIVAWGTGEPRREFLFSDDLGDAVAHLLEQPAAALDPLFRDDAPPLLNVGFGEDIAIRSLVEMVRTVIGYDGAVRWDASKPDGTPRKLLDSGRLHRLGWRPRVGLRPGIERALADYRKRYAPSPA